MTDHCDVIVIGGGAAGLMCAIEAGRRGRKVRVLEGSNRIGKKILMSGGGRCNFTNLHTTPDNFLSANPHFCKSALARYSQWDFIAMVERHGIAYHEKERGQLFCDESSKQVVAMLAAECRSAQVQIEVDSGIRQVRALPDSYQVTTARGDVCSRSLVVACGGLSIPKMGASGFGHELAQQFGLPLQPLRAGLVPLTFRERDLKKYDGLSGVSVPSVAARAGDAVFDGGLLFTHRGLSGPAVLQASSFWSGGDVLIVDWGNAGLNHDWLAERRIERPDAELKTVLAERLPKKLAHRLVELAFENHPMKRFHERDLRAIAERLSNWEFRPDGSEGYRTAEVTLGGVDTAALSSTTMQVKDRPGLYFIGEVVDVTGHLGGFNFQWAWSSGWAAGQVA